MTEDRLIALETRIAHHERMVEDLSAVVADQAKAIARLQEQVLLLRDRVAAAEGGWERSPRDDEPPPHY